MSRADKPEKYHSNLEDELKHKQRAELVGHHDVDSKYLGKCARHYYEYDECVRDLVGDTVSCEIFRKSLQRCEEEAGMYEDVLNSLGIVPKERKYQKYTSLYPTKTTEASQPSTN